MPETYVTLLGVITGALMTIMAAVWRLGTKMGQMTQALQDHNARLERVEDHMAEHDRWHFHRGDH